MSPILAELGADALEPKDLSFVLHGCQTAKQHCRNASV